MNTRRRSSPAKPLTTQQLLWWLGIPVALVWGIEIFDWLFKGIVLDAWGIRPRDVIGLRGIVFAPFLHGDFAHAAANTVPFVIMGGMILIDRPKDFIPAIIIIAIIGGLGTWLVGAQNSVHIGASGIVFGFLGYLLSLGVFEKSPALLARAVIVFMLYGGFMYGVLPQGPGISWEGHLFGLIGGVIAAWLLARK